MNWEFITNIIWSYRVTHLSELDYKYFRVYIYVIYMIYNLHIINTYAICKVTYICMYAIVIARGLTNINGLSP